MEKSKNQNTGLETKSVFVCEHVLACDKYRNTSGLLDAFMCNSVIMDIMYVYKGAKWGGGGQRAFILPV